MLCRKDYLCYELIEVSESQLADCSIAFCIHCVLGEWLIGDKVNFMLLTWLLSIFWYLLYYMAKLYILDVIMSSLFSPTIGQTFLHPAISFPSTLILILKNGV